MKTNMILLDVMNDIVSDYHNVNKMIIKTKKGRIKYNVDFLNSLQVETMRNIFYFKEVYCYSYDASKRKVVVILDK